MKNLITCPFIPTSLSNNTPSIVFDVIRLVFPTAEIMMRRLFHVALNVQGYVSCFVRHVPCPVTTTVYLPLPISILMPTRIPV